MNSGLKGLLVGLALGVGLIVFEYLAAQKSAAARAKKMAQKQELNQDERVRIRNMMTFGLVMVPIIAAAIFWLMDL
ncbi:MAG TPA: hypothetical protein VHN19_05250 [Burkholderiales bacterium]|jgi:hypothetical protein|nr:hypothetical protein [Burkholderiales bacterium]